MTALEPWRLGEVVAERTILVDEVDLFLFSSACRLPHRIHYDAAFARSEGFDDVPVHGPLQASWLVGLAAEWAAPAAGRVVASTVRHVRPAYARQSLRALLRLETAEPGDRDVRLALATRVERADSTATTLGTVVVEVPRGADG